MATRLIHDRLLGRLRSRLASSVNQDIQLLVTIVFDRPVLANGFGELFAPRYSLRIL